LPEYLNDSVSKLCIIAKGPDCEIKIPHWYKSVNWK
jgi:hypothetical protein